MRAFIKDILIRFRQYNSAARVRKFFSQFIKKGDLCFDIGANVGDKTRAFLKLGAKVVCAEPQRQYLNQLYQSFGKNRNAIIVEKGIADKEGVLDLSICQEMPNVSTFSETFRNESIFRKEYACRWAGVEKVAVTTLDILIAQFGEPQFCKIDVEGFEEEALKGLTRPVPVISFEYDDYFFKQMENCISRLSELGNYKFNFTVGDPLDGKGLILAQWVEPDRLLKELYDLKKGIARMWGDIYAKQG